MNGPDEARSQALEAMRDRAIEQVLPAVATFGWTTRALAAVGWSDAEARSCFPGGAVEMIEAFCARADRRMEAAAPGLPAELRTGERLRALVAARLADHRTHRPAARRAFAVLGLPANRGAAARTLFATADAAWGAVGDRSTDMNWYTKRATLAGIYGATLLVWLGTDDPDDERALAFFDRRVATTARLGRLRRRIQTGLSLERWTRPS
ncbi:COQ9 family protein [Acidisphaera rubrifaciens]|uniref:COQ9 C-terminal domain-containing protein n=1 Tax=Acidisphaera rubrifaciens HS-AP3 TaxID=1231350 RepID=A0A0D6P655_9PROT|nr:COQ9 family protein [Acidisphaera rubrifaciens]GAN76678.1 hypothetical protein Asru_0143_02 [Acidisphaera rubrifaciens HS-AP3]